MGWMVQGSNLGGGEIFCTCPDQPWGQLSLLYKGYQFFLRIKWPEQRVHHPPPSSTQVKERLKEYSYPSTPPLALCGLFSRVNFTFTLPLLLWR